MTPDEKENRYAQWFVDTQELRLMGWIEQLKRETFTVSSHINQNPEDHKAAATAIIHRAIELSDCGIVRAILKEALK